MTNLSQDQEEMRQAIQKSAMIWSVVFGLFLAGIIYWLLGGQSMLVRLAAAAIGGIAALIGVFKWRFLAKSKSARCEKCGAAFSISKTDHVETLVSSEAKETREAQEDYSTKVSTWVEEVFDVVDTFTCAGCNEAKTKEYRTTRKKDEEVRIEPAPEKNKPSAKTPVAGLASDTKSGKKSGAASRKKG